MAAEREQYPNQYDEDEEYDDFEEERSASSNFATTDEYNDTTQKYYLDRASTYDERNESQYGYSDTHDRRFSSGNSLGSSTNNTFAEQTQGAQFGDNYAQSNMTYSQQNVFYAPIESSVGDNSKAKGAKKQA
jgi:hypothetical protein